MIDDLMTIISLTHLKSNDSCHAFPFSHLCYSSVKYSYSVNYLSTNEVIPIHLKRLLVFLFWVSEESFHTEDVAHFIYFSGSWM